MLTIYVKGKSKGFLLKEKKERLLRRGPLI